MAIFLGAAIEGEAAVTTGGYLAHRGLVDPYFAAVCAFSGSFVADQIVFFSARFHRERRCIVRVRGRATFARAIRFIERRPVLFCMVFRFIYGMRTVGPIAIGISRVPIATFFIINAVSAAIWATIFTTIGFRFGKAFETFIDRAISDPWAIGGAALVTGGAAFYIYRRYRSAEDRSSTGNL
ncbi:DedA family protein [Sphingomonas sp.]|uniref:DedA family protein n=1 Tax=Sphingomonas sp. TaxID=28214 RepID=UPI0025EF2EB7|nr:DedA family protein [Sphingomonas sp.]